ncbi:unnamed protein product [Gongylonema pulchrum]|uniref:SRI domain-containing protein n=1 Tax=Gongylonema pulchrum TaxID=637853 RepID=A0A183DSJ0_9BILA|nr:unnamed protein product [Gongylonema pulchrum]
MIPRYTLSDGVRATFSVRDLHETSVHHDWKVDDLQDSDESISMQHSANGTASVVIGAESVERRKKRPSRWGTPTTSYGKETDSVTASIPLPVGPPLTQPEVICLENIPIPSSNKRLSPSQQSVIAQPSVLNTTPSTSFAFSASASSVPTFRLASGQPQLSLAPFAGPTLGQQQIGLSQQSLATLSQQQLASLGQQTLASLGQQPLPGLSQPQLTPLGQASLVQMQPPLLPNLLLPPLNLGAMNNLLAAGLLANSNPLAAQSIAQPLTQPSPAPTAPFVLNPTPKPPEGVPPPPPFEKPSIPPNNLSVCEPLAEKIRKLIEASSVRPLCNSPGPPLQTAESDEAEEPSGDYLKAEAGRKSASADDEETGEATVRVKKGAHRNGTMFEEARRMLSSSLKKVYRMRQISKQEYKEIMKKGVMALSQRTKLDQRRVDDYAAKYVECVIHRRKKRH